LTAANLPIRDELGQPVSAQSPYAYAAEDGLFMGMGDQDWSCPPGLNLFDMLVSTVVYVQGGEFWIEGATRGDYAEFSVVDKDDVLGLFTALGLTVGVDVLELGKFAKKYSVPPIVPVWEKTIVMPTAAKVLPGLYMRTHYFNSHETETAHIGVTFITFEDNS
jgi:hypothetical protein